MIASNPYCKCPKCEKDTFDVLLINHNSYKRKCKECNYKEIYSLPLLNKKIVYIDQPALSMMMKAVKKGKENIKIDKQDETWIEMFDKLYKLCRLQLIICPESGFHREESSLCKYFTELKKMYEFLSCGIKFKSDDEIKELQICEHASNWLAGTPEKQIAIEPQSVMDGNINAWQERFSISIDWERIDEIVDGLRNARKEVSKKLGEAAKRWQQEKDKNFDDWFKEESSGYGKALLKEYCTSIKRLSENYQKGQIFTLDDITAPFSLPSSLLRSLKFLFIYNGVNESVACSKVIEYLNSDSLRFVPFVEISSLLLATLARKYATGMHQLPEESIETDINIVSVLLPYCDAMFIDKQMHGYLKDNPVNKRLSYKTKIFSSNHKAEFMGYLENIEQNVSKERIEKVREVYGE